MCCVPVIVKPGDEQHQRKSLVIEERMVEIDLPGNVGEPGICQLSAINS